MMTRKMLANWTFLAENFPKALSYLLISVQVIHFDRNKMKDIIYGLKQDASWIEKNVIVVKDVASSRIQ